MPVPEDPEILFPEDELPENAIVTDQFAITRFGSDDKLNEAINQMERALTFVDKVRAAVLKRTTADDWTNQSGKAFIGETGVVRFRAAFQMYEKNLKSWTVTDTGERRDSTAKNAFEGTIKFIFFEGIVGSKILNAEAHFDGGARLNDGFWDKDDYLDYWKKAKANFVGRAFRRLLGLDNISWEVLEKHGIKQLDVKKIDRLTTPKAESADQLMLHKLLLDLNEGDAAKAEDYLFKMTNSDQYKGKRKASQLTDGQMKWIMPKVQSEHKKRFPNKPAAEGAAPTAPSDSPPTLEVFLAAAGQLAEQLGEAQYQAVCTAAGIDDVERLAPAGRNKFLNTLRARVERINKQQTA